MIHEFDFVRYNSDVLMKAEIVLKPNTYLSFSIVSYVIKPRQVASIVDICRTIAQLNCIQRPGRFV